MSATPREFERNQAVSQWIISLAVSVICCAVLFLIGAGYVFNLNEKATLATVKVELLEARQNQLVTELDALRRPVPVTTNVPPGVVAPGTVAPVATTPVAPAPATPAAP